MDLRVPGEHAVGHHSEGGCVGQVALLVLAAYPGRERPQAALASRDEHAVPAAKGELLCRRLADPRRRARDDGYAANVRTVPRLIATVSWMFSA
jgi:hypothetical protein